MKKKAIIAVLVIGVLVIIIAGMPGFKAGFNAGFNAK